MTPTSAPIVTHSTTFNKTLNQHEVSIKITFPQESTLCNLTNSYGINQLDSCLENNFALTGPTIGDLSSLLSISTNEMSVLSNKPLPCFSSNYNKKTEAKLITKQELQKIVDSVQELLKSSII